MKKTNGVLLAALTVCVGFSSCSKDNKPEEGTGDAKSRYVFQVASVGTDGGATYIVPVENITSGTISTTGNGTETDGYSFINQNNMIFGLVWSTQGPITPYKLNDQGKVLKMGEPVNAVRALAYGPVKTDRFVFAANGSLAAPDAAIMDYDTKNFIIAKRGNINTLNITGINELATFTGVTDVDNNKLFLPYYTATGVSGVTSKYTDSMWIAVVNYPDLTMNKVIRDGRASYSGNWFSMTSVKQIEDGDTYAWCSAYNSKNPSSFLRVKKGALEFDKDYFFNVEAKTGGLKIVRGRYIANGKFLVAIEASKRDVAPSRGGGDPADVKVAIADVRAQTITYITGIPQYNAPWYDFPAYYEGDGKTAQFVLRESEERYRVYTIDINAATATKGAEIIGSNVSSISKLTY